MAKKERVLWEVADETVKGWEGIVRREKRGSARGAIGGSLHYREWPCAAAARGKGYGNIGMRCDLGWLYNFRRKVEVMDHGC